MNIWAKMITALRGGANEMGEAIIDSQALRILDQEVRDSSEELRESKSALASIMAQQKLAEEKCAELKKAIETHEGYATQALEKGQEALALEVAEKIADKENQLASEQAHAESFAKSASDLRAAVNQAEQNIKRLKQQVDTVKATENVQRAQAAVAEKYGGSDSKLRTAMDSLERIKEKQKMKSATMKAATELAQDNIDDSLEQKLEQAGIKASHTQAKDVLERLKAKKS